MVTVLVDPRHLEVVWSLFQNGGYRLESKMAEKVDGKDMVACSFVYAINAKKA